MAGTHIQAHSLEEAEAIARSWRRNNIVPPTFKVEGELIEEIYFDEIQRAE